MSNLYVLFFFRAKESPSSRSDSPGKERKEENIASNDEVSKKKDVIPSEVAEEAEKIRKAIEDTRKNGKSGRQKSPSEKVSDDASASEPPKEKVIPASRSSRKYRQRSSSNSSSGSEGQFLLETFTIDNICLSSDSSSGSEGQFLLKTYLNY